MAEEKQEKKKTGIVKRIFKWLGLGLLSILLIAAIYFQAPWKVITLLVVILLACTVLPKPLRKWFWLSAGVVVIALIIWVFLPDDNKGWRPYTFDEELAAIEAKRAIPPEENAATIYNQLLESYDANELEPNLPDPNINYLTRSEPWSSEDYPELAQWLKSHQSTIATLIEASKIEKCRFPINADLLGLGQSLDRLAAMRHWAYSLLIRAANNDLGEDRTDQALEKYIAVLKMAKHQYQQPAMIDLLVAGISVEALAFRQFNRFIITGDATEEQLALIKEALADIKHDWSSDLPRILECEKLMMKNFFGMFYEINPEGKTRLSRDPTAVFRAHFPEDMPPPTHWQRKLTKIGIIFGWFFVPSTPQKVGEIINASYERLYATTEPNFKWQKAPEKHTGSFMLNFRYLIEYLAGILEPAYYSIHDTYIRHTAQQRGSRIIIALRRYKNKTGQWPEGLDDIRSLAPAEIFVDPFNNDSFVYKLTEENFTLYSKGKNNIDDGGKREEEAGADDVLIWPPRSCKTKEKNTDAKQQ